MNPTHPNNGSGYPDADSFRSTGPYVLHRGDRQEWRGWLSEVTLLDSESREELHSFRQEFERVLNPLPGFVSVLFDYLVASAWRLRRMPRLEADLWNYYGGQGASGLLGLGGALIAGQKGHHFLAHLGRYESGLRHNFSSTLEWLQELRIKKVFQYSTRLSPLDHRARVLAHFGLELDPEVASWCAPIILEALADPPSLPNRPPVNGAPANNQAVGRGDAPASTGAGLGSPPQPRRDWRGWLMDEILVDGERGKDFELFRRQFQRQLNLPPGLVATLCDHLVISAWRLRRMACAEAAAFNHFARQGANQKMGLGAALVASTEGNHFLLHLCRFESGLRRNFFKAFKLLLQLHRNKRFPYQPDPEIDYGLDLMEYFPDQLPNNIIDHLLTQRAHLHRRLQGLPQPGAAPVTSAPGPSSIPGASPAQDSSSISALLGPGVFQASPLPPLPNTQPQPSTLEIASSGPPPAPEIFGPGIANAESPAPGAGATGPTADPGLALAPAPIVSAGPGGPNPPVPAVPAETATETQGPEDHPLAPAEQPAKKKVRPRYRSRRPFRRRPWTKLFSGTSPEKQKPRSTMT